jgi:hypothetical protein
MSAFSVIEDFDVFESKPMCSGTPLAGAVFLDQPLARATQLQAGPVDQQVDAGGMRLRRQFQALSASAEGGEIAALALAGSGTGRSRPSNWRTEPITV